MRRYRGEILRALVAVGVGLALAGLTGCGGSSDSGGSNLSAPPPQVIASAAANVASMVVDCGPSATCSGQPTTNEAFVTVTVCPPGGTTSCQTFDHIQVDTQSYGLRLLADATDKNGSPLDTANFQAETQTTGGSIAECAVFADGYSWGPVVTADVQISEESASSVPMQIIGDTDPPFAKIPSDCTSQGGGYQEDTVATFGANGILGVGVFVQDCGTGCAPGGGYAVTYYYTCSTSTGACSDSTVSTTQQVSNPVAYFATDDNGVIIELPSVPSAGAATVTGALVFGIDTESNNALGSATVFQADPNVGSITTDFDGQTLSGSILDTGSNAFFFADSSIQSCSGQLAGLFYCPSSTLTLSGTISSADGNASGTSSTVDFNVANAENLNGNYTAFDDLAGPLSSGLSSSSGGIFDWGLPFFFGRNVYVAIQGMNTSAGDGPYYAF
jgi:Protein of unknown function (DUF3443)